MSKVIKYFSKHNKSSGLCICKLADDGNEYPMCTMRWSDGMNPSIEENIENDANIIVIALNSTLDT